MSFTKEDVFYTKEQPQEFADKLNAALVEADDAANALKIGTLANLTTSVKIDVVTAVNSLVTAVAGKAKVVVISGAASGAVALGDTPASVIAVLAVVKASGAVATKFLLTATTDYTIATSNLTCVTDQSLNNLIVIYK